MSSSPIHPESFFQLPKVLQQEIVDSISEKELYDTVEICRKSLQDETKMHQILKDSPAVAKKYYSYVINKEIWKVHEDQRLTKMFKSTTTPTSESEKELSTLLPSKDCSEYLTRLNLTELNKDEIAAIIHNLPNKLENIKWIDLGDSGITAQDFQALLQKCSNIRYLRLTNANSLKDFDPKKFPTLQVLEWLDISMTDLTPEDVKILLKHCPNIKWVNQTKIPVNMGLSAMSQMSENSVPEDKRDFFGWQILPFSFAKYHSGLALEKVSKKKTFAIIDNLPEKLKLKQLNLINPKLSFDDVQKILQEHYHIEVLFLQDIPITHEPTNFPTLINLKTLIFLNSQQTQTDKKGIQTIVQQCPKLESIALNYPDINKDDVQTIAQQCPKLKRIILDLSQTSLMESLPTETQKKIGYDMLL